MAAADYKLCDACGGKTFYDADLHYEDPQSPNYDPLPVGVGAWVVLCKACAETHVIEFWKPNDRPSEEWS